MAVDLLVPTIIMPRAKLRAALRVLIIRILPVICWPLSPKYLAFVHRRSGRPSCSLTLGLVPVAKFCNKIDFLSSRNSRGVIDQNGYYRTKEGESYQICLAEEADLPDLARFVVRSFGADAIRLSQDINAFEKALMQPAVELVNSYSGIVAFAEVLVGLRSRLQHRLERTMNISSPMLTGMSRPEKIERASQTSIVLVIARPTDEISWHVDVVGSVELRLEQCDAKIPFSWPWLDRIERNLAAAIGIDRDRTKDLQPYLSNLCVDEKFRRSGIGKSLVRCVESIARDAWGYSRLYLHVDPDNKAAYKLYQSEGYKDVGRRWKPFWAGKAADIAYFVKKLRSAAVGPSSESSHS